MENPGYHLVDIKKGVIGDLSKIIEEYEEYLDAVDQDSAIMALVELSDLFGAIRHYCKKNNLNFKKILKKSSTWDTNISLSFDDAFDRVKKDPREDSLINFLKHIDIVVDDYNMTLDDLEKMADITERAFVNGRR